MSRSHDISLAELPEVFRSSTDISASISAAASEGRVRRIGPNLYTHNMADPVDAIVRRNLWQIIHLLHPDTVVSHRTAFEMRPAEDGTVFLTGRYNRLQKLPGLTISLREGPGPLDGDVPFMGSLWLASGARRCLEVLQPSRSRSTVARGLPAEAVEEHLEDILQRGGESDLNALRDRARSIAVDLDAEEEARTLDGLIGTLLGTRDARVHSARARARVAGSPYDAQCMGRLQDLVHTLHTSRWSARPDAPSGGEFRNLAFYDAYFSNFIEGTEFEVEEAEQIVFDQVIPAARPDDAHDVLRTFQLVSRRDIMSRSAVGLSDADAFMSRLQDYHSRMLPQRPTARPGMFKEVPNRAGETHFVSPDLVRGTLAKGYELLLALEHAFARAVYLSVLITEVHPFRDGNGRMARLMMNAELVSAHQRRILIPTGYREDYLLALRAFSRRGESGPVMEMFTRAQSFAAEIDFSDLDAARRLLRRCGAFGDPDDSVLRLPSEHGLATRDAGTGDRIGTLDQRS